MAEVENIRTSLELDYKALEVLQDTVRDDVERGMMYASILSDISYQIFALESCYTDDMPGNRETLCLYARHTHLGCREFLDDPV